MPYKPMPLDFALTVQRLNRQGLTVAAIARELGVDLTDFFASYRAAILRAGIAAPDSEQLALMVDVLLECLAERLPDDDPMLPH